MGAFNVSPAGYTFNKRMFGNVMCKVVRLSNNIIEGHCEVTFLGDDVTVKPTTSNLQGVLHKALIDSCVEDTLSESTEPPYTRLI